MIKSKMKQSITFILALVMVMGVLTTAVFADTPSNYKSEAERIQELVDKGYVTGYEDGSIGEYNSITRAEFAAIAVRASGLEDVALQMQSIPSGFPDVQTYDWHNGYVGVARSNGLISGYPNGEFRPHGNITYGEALTVMVRMLLTPQEQMMVENSAQWPTNYFMKASQLGLLNNVNGITVGATATRGQIFLVLSNVINIVETIDTVEVNAIVTENKEDSFSLVILKDSGSFKKDDKLTLKNNKELMEKIAVGKVYDLRVNGDNKITSIEENKNAIIKSGKIEKNRRDFVIDGKTYDLDSLLSLRLNDRETKHSQFPINVEFSQSTIFNGKLIFVNAYSFDEIMPIQEVKNNRIYGITKEGTTRILSTNRNTSVFLLDNGVKVEIDVDDIKSGDIAYVLSDRGNTDIYITQNTVKGVVGSINSKTKTVKINDKEFAIEENTFPTILVQEKRYLPIVDINRLKALDKFEVVASINLNGKIQLIEATKDVSIYSKAIVEDITKDKIHVITEDGHRENLYVTEYTELIQERNRNDRFDRFDRFDRDNRFNRYHVERIIAQITKGDVVKVLVDGRGDIEEIEILKGKEVIITDMDYDVVQIDKKAVYLSADFTVFQINNEGRYEKLNAFDFEDTFFRYRNATVKATIFEANKEIEVIIVKEVKIDVLNTLMNSVAEAKALITTAKNYKESNDVRVATASLERLVGDIEYYKNEMYEEDVVIAQKDIKLEIDRLNKAVLAEALGRLSERVEEVKTTEKPYNLENYNAIKDFYTATSKATIINYATTIKEIETTLANFDKKVYEEVVIIINKDLLENKIEEVEALTEQDYTIETWESLQNVLEEAIMVYENEKATQANVDKAVRDLNSAILALEEAVEEEIVEIYTTTITFVNEDKETIKESEVVELTLDELRASEAPVVEGYEFLNVKRSRDEDSMTATIVYTYSVE